MIRTKASDYIVDYLCGKGIHHFFGYQGTMIAHLIDSIGKNENVENHCCYNEQGAAFAAVGYAKISGRCAVAYATSGPGAINLVSGIADAFYDSAPVIFLTGQLNTNEHTDIPQLRQQGFQETNVISIVSSITKYCKMITKAEDIPIELEKAFRIATSGRKGPVLLDIPMNMQRAEIEDKFALDCETLGNLDEPVFCNKYADPSDDFVVKQALDALKKANCPLLVLGNGISKNEQDRKLIRHVLEQLDIPVLTSMLGRDILPMDHPLNFGMIGSAYGHRYANLLACQKADFILCLGCSLCPRQTGTHPELFAPQAQIMRIDIDSVQLKRKIHKDEMAYQMDAMDFFVVLSRLLSDDEEKSATSAQDGIKTGSKRYVEGFKENEDSHKKWLKICRICKDKLQDFDADLPEMTENRVMKKISEQIEDNRVICADVGQHQVWTATSFVFKRNQRFICSGGHGAMGFSIPAAIGAHYATGQPVVVLCGDGGAQMNIQELQWIRRDNLPIVIYVLNNSSLGLVRQQQDSIFERRYIGAAPEGGYVAPDFEKIAKAYGIEAETIDVSAGKLLADDLFSHTGSKGPRLIQVMLGEETGAFPKTVFGEPMYNQKPYVSSELMEELLSL